MRFQFTKISRKRLTHLYKGELHTMGNNSPNRLLRHWLLIRPRINSLSTPTAVIITNFWKPVLRKFSTKTPHARMKRSNRQSKPSLNGVARFLLSAKTLQRILRMLNAQTDTKRLQSGAKDHASPPKPMEGSARLPSDKQAQSFIPTRLSEIQTVIRSDLQQRFRLNHAPYL